MKPKKHSGYFRYVIAVLLATFAVIAYIVGVNTYISSQPRIEDNFIGSPYALKSGDASPNGIWYAVSDGGGSLGVRPDQQGNNNTSTINNNIFYEYSKVPEGPKQSASVLALTNSQFRNFQMSVDVRTDKQLRQNSPPHTWETAWVIWRWIDNTHFYYFVEKTNGIEVGKYDGGTNPTNQIIVKSERTHPAIVGKWTHWNIFVLDAKILISIDGERVFWIDNDSSFDTGKIGLYSEDSAVSFDNVTIQGL